MPQIEAARVSADKAHNARVRAAIGDKWTGEMYYMGGAIMGVRSPDGSISHARDGDYIVIEKSGAKVIPALVFQATYDIVTK